MSTTKISTAQLKNLDHHHIQDVASTIWSIVHNLNKFPSVIVVDGDGDEVVGNIRHNSLNALTISFSIPIVGQAHLN